LHFWQELLRILASRKLYSDVLLVHTIAHRVLPNDSVVLSCLVQAALEKGSAAQISALTESLSTAELRPKDYALFFKAYKALNQVDGAEALLKKLGSDATPAMLNSVLGSLMAARQVDRARDLVRWAHEVEKTKEVSIVDSTSYTILLRGCSEARLQGKAYSCFQDMMENGVEFDAMTVGALLDVSSTEHRAELAGFVQRCIAKKGPSMHGKLPALVRILAKYDCVAQALDLFEHMRAIKTTGGDIVMYGQVVKCMLQCDKIDDVFQLFDSMQEDNVIPDDPIFTRVLDGCRERGKHELGKKFFAKQLELGIPPSAYTLMALLKLLCNGGFFDEACGYLKNSSLVKPTVLHYTVVMMGCLKNRLHDEAWEIFELMCSRHETPDSVCLSTLFMGMATAKAWEHVVVVAELATALKGCRIPTEAIRGVLSQMRQGGADQALIDRLSKAVTVDAKAKPTQPTLVTQPIDESCTKGPSAGLSDDWLQKRMKSSSP